MSTWHCPLKTRRVLFWELNIFRVSMWAIHCHPCLWVHTVSPHCDWPSVLSCCCWSTSELSDTPQCARCSNNLLSVELWICFFCSSVCPVHRERCVYTGSAEWNVCLGLPPKPLYCVVHFECLCSMNFVRCFVSYVKSFAVDFILCSVCVRETVFSGHVYCCCVCFQNVNFIFIL